VKIICIGDSCTYGQGVRSSEAWPAVLERLTGHDVRNAGVCGDTTRLGLERFFRDVGMHRPDVVVIQFGHNDANRWETDFGTERVGIHAYVANVNDLVARCEAIQARPIILAPHPTIRRFTPTEENYDWRIGDYRKALGSRAIGTGATLLDDGYGVHPDVAMHERYAELVAGAL
jgi:lysophospholipase L1-like esterase